MALIADDGDGSRIEAYPGAAGWCPGCRERLIPRCGTINAWHWSHHASDCDPWYEPESEWHLAWKRLVGLRHCEVVRGAHRADIVSPGGVVIELQHSAIDIDEAWEREQFYGRMVWLFDARSFFQNVGVRRKEGETGRSYYRTFRWKHPRRTQTLLRRPLYWDTGEGWLFEVRKVYPNIPCGGWGYWITAEEFVKRFFGQEA